MTNSKRIPHRTIKSLHDELRWLYNRIMEQTEPGFKWDSYSDFIGFVGQFSNKRPKDAIIQTDIIKGF